MPSLHSTNVLSIMVHLLELIKPVGLVVTHLCKYAKKNLVTLSSHRAQFVSSLTHDLWDLSETLAPIYRNHKLSFMKLSMLFPLKSAWCMSCTLSADLINLTGSVDQKTTPMILLVLTLLNIWVNCHYKIEFHQSRSWKYLVSPPCPAGLHWSPFIRIFNTAIVFALSLYLSIVYLINACKIDFCCTASHTWLML